MKIRSGYHSLRHHTTVHSSRGKKASIQAVHHAFRWSAVGIICFSLSPLVFAESSLRPEDHPRSASIDDGSVQTATVNPIGTQGVPGGTTDITTPPGTPEQQYPNTGPFAGFGKKLNSLGVRPIFNLIQMYLANPSAGSDTRNHEAVSIVSYGADFDLERLMGLSGTLIHFVQLATFSTNDAYGMQVGDSIVGPSAPFLPKVSHLGVFTIEKKAFGNRLDVEFGKTNPGLNFGLPTCNTGFGCQNMPYAPPVYSDWGGRVAYSVTPELTVQAGLFRHNAASAFTNGWEWSDNGTGSNTILANLTYKTTFATTRYPYSFEVLYYRDSAEQTNPLTSATHKGTSYLYFAGKKTVWRPDDADEHGSPSALSVFGTLLTTLDQYSSRGLQNYASGGLTWDGPFKSRPHDSYSVQVNWTRLTGDEQKFLQNSSYDAGSRYTVPRNEFTLSLNANIQVTDSIIVTPYVSRTWGINTFSNPMSPVAPRNGYAGGVLMIAFFDKMLGLAGN
ncbi:porin [Paraburkholderia sp. WC7.3g]|uniref:carbohydrate porin n=1 Tax=Paraburkholderia sp. WC7.3g TaxID=2991070 RepID=UPI003D2150B9